jgi:HNH endonuclease
MASLREVVWDRAGGCCEYCQLPQSLTILPHALDHIISQQHGGATIESNLCLACALCNAHKGPNLAGIDPLQGRLVRLFHPRTDRGADHFHWRGAILEGRTDVGRTTVRVLAINDADRVLVRQLAIKARLLGPAKTEDTQ